MNTKDWILLLVPVLCNGVVVYVLQKIFERKQLISAGKYRYVTVLQQKTDNALALFVQVLQASGNDSEQIIYLNLFIKSYCDVFYFYQQNQTIFKPLKKYMDELIKTHEEIKTNQLRANDIKHSHEVSIHLQSLLRKIFELLQSIQKDCINHVI